MSSSSLPYTREVLSNGLTVLAYPMKEIQAVCLILRLHSGLFYEEEQGLGHATEHFLFLGTKNFPTEREVSEHLESLGAAHNGNTDDRHIEIWLHLPKKNLEKALRFLAELAFTSIIPASAVEKERNVVLQEWKRRHDDPYFRFYRHMIEQRFSDPNHPYARDESRSLLENFTRDNVANFYKRFFQPQQMVLGIGGGVEPKKVSEMIHKYFGAVSAGKPISEPVLPTDAYSGLKTITHEEKFSQANLEITFPAFGWREKPREVRLAAGMGLRILGGSIVSRLWRILREEKGLVYNISSGLDLKPWLGTTEISTTCTASQLREVLMIIKDEVNRFVDQGPTDKELDLEKEYRLGRLAIGFEGSFGTARYFVSEEFNQEGILLPEDQIKMIESVEKSDIDKVIKPLFDWSRVQVGLMNDFQQLAKEKFEKLAREILQDRP